MLWNKIKESVKNVLVTAKSMPVTLAFIYLATILSVIFVDDGFEFAYRAVAFTVLGLLLAAAGSFYAETGFAEKNPLRYVIIAVTALLSGFFAYVLCEKPLDYSANFMDQYFLPLIVAYGGIAVVLSVWNCFKKSGKALNAYITGVFMSFLYTGIVLAILNSGFMMLVLIFNALIVSWDRLFTIVLILLAGLISLPAYLIALQNTGEQKGRFPKVLISYIMCPLVVLAYLIIYLYMGKLLVTRSIPSNQIFAILTGMFIAGAPVFLMTEYVNDAPVFRVGLRILYILYLPFVLLQCYSVGIRIAQYGITPSRYFGIVIILIELIWLLMSILKPGKRGMIFWVLAAFLLLAMVIPGTTFNSVSVASQNRMVENYRASATPKTAAKAYGAVQYLSNEPDEIRTAVSQMSTEELQAFREELLALKSEGGEEAEEEYTHGRWFYYTMFDSEGENVDISEFSSLTCVHAYQSISAESEEEGLQALWEIELDTTNSEFLAYVDLSDLVRDYFEYLRAKGVADDADVYAHDGTVNAPYTWRFVPIDDEHVLYLQYFEMNGNRKNGELILDYINLNGFVLTR